VAFYIKPADGFMLPFIMQRLKQTFAARYNVMKRLDGHVWGDRYWSKVLEGEPPGEEIPGSEPLCGDCGGNVGEERPKAEAGGQIPEACLEEGPPGGDSLPLAAPGLVFSARSILTHPRCGRAEGEAYRPERSIWNEWPTTPLPQLPLLIALLTMRINGELLVHGNRYALGLVPQHGVLP
jgi:hypothetical protein